MKHPVVNTLELPGVCVVQYCMLCCVCHCFSFMVARLCHNSLTTTPGRGKEHPVFIFLVIIFVCVLLEVVICAYLGVSRDVSVPISVAFSISGKRPGTGDCKC